MAKADHKVTVRRDHRTRVATATCTCGYTFADPDDNSRAYAVREAHPEAVAVRHRFTARRQEYTRYLVLRCSCGWGATARDRGGARFLKDEHRHFGGMSARSRRLLSALDRLTDLYVD